MSVCLLALALAVTGPAQAEEPAPFLLIFPIFGSCPPEMDLPWAGHLAESVLLEMPESGLRVEAQEPTEPVGVGAIEAVARQRAAELSAQAVLWGELVQPAACKAPRMIRLRILELSSEKLITRDICPEGAGVEDISRAMALATVNALRAGELQSLPIAAPPDRSAATKRIPPAPRCKASPPCPDCPPCPPPPPPEPVRPVWLRPHALMASGFLTSHPRWEGLGLGVEVDWSYSPLSWLELGLGLSATRGRSFGVDGVRGLYSSWPARFWTGFRFGRSLEGVVQIGVALAWSRLDVLLQESGQAISASRLNPFLYGRVGLRYWTRSGVGVQALLGPAWYLRRQRYTHGASGEERTVMSMQSLSLEASLGLLVAIP